MVGYIKWSSVLLLVIVLFTPNFLYAESCLPLDDLNGFYTGQIYPLQNSTLTNWSDFTESLSHCGYLMTRLRDCELNESHKPLMRNTYTTCRDSFLKFANSLKDNGDYGLAVSVLTNSKEFMNETNAIRLARLTPEEYYHDYDQIQSAYEQNVRHIVADLETKLKESNYSNCTAARAKAEWSERLLILYSEIQKRGLGICNDAPNDVNNSYTYYVQCMEICSHDQQTRWNYLDCFERRLTIMEDYDCLLPISFYEKANLYESAGRNFTGSQGNLSEEFFYKSARIWGGIGYNFYLIPAGNLTDEDYVNSIIAFRNSYTMFYYANKKIEMQEQMNEWLSLLNAFAVRQTANLKSFTLITLIACLIWFLIIEEFWFGAPIKGLIEKLMEEDNSIKILTPIGIILSVAFTVSFSGASSQIDKISAITKPDYILNDAAYWTYFGPFFSLSVGLGFLSVFLFLIVWLFNKGENAKSLWMKFLSLLAFCFFLSSALAFVSTTANEPFSFYQLSWLIIFIILFVRPNQFIGLYSLLRTKINWMTTGVQKDKRDKKDEKELQKVILRYPNIASLGLKLREVTTCTGANEEFSLKDILEREQEPYWGSFLTSLNELVGKTQHIFKNRQRLKGKINSSPFSTKWELEVADFCLSKKIEITSESPTTGNSNVDFKIKLAHRFVLLEAYTKRNLGNPKNIITEIVRKKIHDNAIPKKLSSPWIIAVDGEYSGLDHILLEAGFDSNPDVPLLSGVILKHHGFKLHINPNARNPLSPKKIKALGI